jgi:PAS domain S-box-containing protein
MKPLMQTMQIRSRGRRQSDRALAFLANLAGEFSIVLNLPELLGHVLRTCRQELGFDSCALALVDEDDKDAPPALRIRAASGLRTNYMDLAIPAGTGPHGEVMRSGRPLLVPDMAADLRAAHPEPNIRSGIYAPLAVRGRILGVLSAHRAAPNAFTIADLDLLTIVAGYVAGAVETGRLHDQIKEQALNATHQLADALDVLNVPMIIATLSDGMILRWNRAATHVYGYAPAETVGLAVFLLEPPDERRALGEVLIALRNGGTVRPVEAIHAAKDGRHMRVTVASHPMRNAEGRARWALFSVTPHPDGAAGRGSAA